MRWANSAFPCLLANRTRRAGSVGAPALLEPTSWRVDAGIVCSARGAKKLPAFKGRIPTRESRFAPTYFSTPAQPQIPRARPSCMSLFSYLTLHRDVDHPREILLERFWVDQSQGERVQALAMHYASIPVNRSLGLHRSGVFGSRQKLARDYRRFFQ